jgi:hypothetical protein
MDIPHELRDEFPQEISLIERMIRTNYEFRRLAEPPERERPEFLFASLHEDECQPRLHNTRFSHGSRSGISS